MWCRTVDSASDWYAERSLLHANAMQNGRSYIWVWCRRVGSGRGKWTERLVLHAGRGWWAPWSILQAGECRTFGSGMRCRTLVASARLVFCVGVRCKAVGSSCACVTERSVLYARCSCVRSFTRVLCRAFGSALGRVSQRPHRLGEVLRGCGYGFGSLLGRFCFDVVSILHEVSFDCCDVASFCCEFSLLLLRLVGLF